MYILIFSGRNPTLFLDKTGKQLPVNELNLDPVFLEYSLRCPKIEITKKSKEVPVYAKTNIRFLLRSFFGIGAKAESVLYLLTHDADSPREIAEATGFFWLSVQQVLVEMEKSKLIQTRLNNKRIEYWLSQNRWWQFISYSAPGENPGPIWLNWWQIFSALTHLWHTLEAVTNENLSNYMTSSRIHDSIEVLYKEFSSAGVDIPPPPMAGLPSEMYENSVMQFFNTIFKSKEVIMGK